jgi:hypothetical protein
LARIRPRDALVDFLTSDDEKADAWASVLGITRAEIPEHIAGLTDVVLQVDTRVTNHGYRDGSPVAIDSILQAGTAVLVDEYGVPRVRCYCGNPLLEPRPLTTADPTVSGTAWDGFDLARSVIISAVDPLTELILDDMVSDALLTRRLGSEATEATPVPTAPPAESTTSRSSSTTSTTDPSTDTTAMTARQTQTNTTATTGRTTTATTATATTTSSSSSTTSSSSSTSSSDTSTTREPPDTTAPTPQPTPQPSTTSTQPIIGG